jgi:L-phenylalanine/L-methionine N-acetyltransferase
MNDIVIRRATLKDAVGIANVMGAPGVVAGTLQIPFATAERWEKKLAGNGEHDHVLVATVGDEIIGLAGLHGNPNHPRRSHAAGIGMGVRDDWQGRGVGKRFMVALIDLADNWLNLSRLELSVFCDNARAVALYKQFGFVVEGTHTRYALRAGELVDCYSMARARG